MDGTKLLKLGYVLSIGQILGSRIIVWGIRFR